MIYQNFDLEIICPQGGNRLCARVLESPQGDCPFIDVKWPFDADTENRLLTEIYGGLRQRHGRSVQATSIQDFGGKLFEAVFSGDIEHLFRSSLDTSFREGKGLRIRLRLPEDSELHMRPWEFLFDTESREFLAVREHTPLVRYLPVAQPIPPITVEGPLRVLVALSSPTDHPRLDIAREWEILCHALEPSISAGQLVLRRVPGHCTFDNLRDSLRHFGAHIFHFVGHGIPGALVLEQESGKGLEMEATHLRSAFPSGALPRLIVLNACSGAITQDVPFSGLAQGFLRQGVPAVVAMQASITDDAAMIFTRYFYRDLVEIGAVDASLTEARLRMQGNGHPIEWGTPVLYMRALNGQLFRPAPEPILYPDERSTASEAPARVAASPPRVEPILPERKRTREVTARQDAAAAPPGAGQVDKKKPRAARVKDTPPPVKPGADPEPPKAQVKAYSPPLKPASEQAAPTVEAPPLPAPPVLAPKPAEPVVPVKVAPPGSTAQAGPPSTPAAYPIAPPVAPPPPLPRVPEPKPAERIILPRSEPKAALKPKPKPDTPPVEPESPLAPKPLERTVPPRAASEASTPPLTPAAPAEEFTVPLPPEPPPPARQLPPRDDTPHHAPQARQEPALDADKTLLNAQPRPFVPVFTFEPDPQLAQQGLMGDAAAEKPAAQSHAAVPGPGVRTRRVRVAASAGLLAAAVGIAIGVKFLPSTGSRPGAAASRPPITPVTRAPATVAVPVASPPAAGPDTTAAAMPYTATAPAASRGAGEARPDAFAQANDHQGKRKSVAAAARKAQPPRKAASAARGDLCKSALVSERPASCLFKKQ